MHYISENLIELYLCPQYHLRTSLSLIISRIVVTATTTTSTIADVVNLDLADEFGFQLCRRHCGWNRGRKLTQNQNLLSRTEKPLEQIHLQFQFGCNSYRSRRP